jgi:outer membrane protein assembly factor BamD
MSRTSIVRFVVVTLTLTLVVLLCGCGIGKRLFGKKKPDTSPDVMTKEGIEQLKKRDYIEAAEIFTKVKDRYPYSEEATVAQLKLADTLYYNRKFDEAQAAYKEFEKLHPTNKAIPYVIYQQALCFYRERPTIDRDQTPTEKAMEEFRRLQKKFPQSEYAAKAEKYKQRCLNDLAEHEFYVGEFYFKTKHYPSALDRFQAISQEYPNFKPEEVKRYIKDCQTNIDNPQKTEGFFSKLFDAKW